MRKKQNRIKVKYIVLSMLVLLISLISIIFGGGVGGAYAAAVDYTSVMQDLEKDEKFNLADYPQKANDYSLQVIQIAESTDGKLFLYVYNPCGVSRPLIATRVSIALAEKVVSGDYETHIGYIPGGITEYVWSNGGGGGFGGSSGGGGGGGGSHGVSLLNERAASGDNTKLYNLTFLSSDGVFGKYLVNGLTVSKDTTRYYNITSIYRKWDSKIDGAANDDNVINEKAFKVGQKWTAITTLKGVEYKAVEVETVTITAEMLGMHRFSDGFQFDGTKSCDSHFIAFDCDHKIDNLRSADIEFYTSKYIALNGEGKFEEPVKQTTTLYGYQVASNDGSGWFGDKKEWHRMTSTKEYINEVGNSITGEEKETLLKYDWILNFYETNYTCDAGGKDVLICLFVPFGWIWTTINSLTTSGEIVSDVSLMHLEFDYNGEVYSLGVVSNTQTGTNKPLNGGFDFFVWLADKLGVPVWAAKLILAVVILLPVLGILLPILSAVFPIVGTVCKAVLKAIWWVISLPFKGIAALVRKIRGE